jgi:hypothetical protein
MCVCTLEISPEELAMTTSVLTLDRFIDRIKTDFWARKTYNTILDPAWPEEMAALTILAAVWQAMDTLSVTELALILVEMHERQFQAGHPSNIEGETLEAQLREIVRYALVTELEFDPVLFAEESDRREAYPD